MRAVLAKMNGVAQALPWFILGLAGVLGMMGVLYPGWVDAKLLIGGLLFAGPVLMIWLSCVQCSAKRRLHHWQTVWQIATMVLLAAALPHDPTTLLSPSVGLVLSCLVAVQTLRESLLAPQFFRLHYDTIMGVLITMSSLLLGLHLVTSMDIRTPTASPVFAYVCTMVALLVVVAWRWTLWYWGAGNTFSNEQHRDAWGHQQKKGHNNDVWWKVFMYARHSDPQPALDVLPLTELLKLMEMPTLFKLAEELKGFPATQLIHKTKVAINKKEPRALVMWELYDEQEALVNIRQLLNTGAHASDTLDLPDL